MAKEKITTIDELKFDNHNFNKHTADGMELLEKSVKNHKFGRSILVDKDNNIIAGNGIVETAKKLDMKKVKVIETTGDELVVVKRTDVDINTKEGREMALADNATSANDLAWDYEELAKAEDEWDINAEDWNVDLMDDDTSNIKHAQDDDFDEDNAIIECRCKEGEMWQLGEHIILCGDSAKNEDVNRLMGGGKS